MLRRIRRPALRASGARRLLSSSSPSFSLSEAFLAKYKDARPPFGFNGLGELVYRRTYSRLKEDGRNEEWWETVARVVNGTYSLQRRWIEEHELGWNPWRAQKSAQEMYERVFSMKFLPPGRGLWAMGTALTAPDRPTFAALNNCAFVSTADLQKEPSKPFCFLMEASMLGVGVGFDTKGAGSVVVRGVDASRAPEHYDVEDSREGWVEALRRLVDAHVLGGAPQTFSFGRVRPAGTPIRGFGGVASGPDALRQMLAVVGESLAANAGAPLSVTTVVDVMNLIGRCVVAGNVRQTAEIAFGDATLDEYLDLKNYEVNPRRAPFGWTSNNSVFAERGMDYGPVCDRIRDNGEPGLAWLDNMREYGRMNGAAPDGRDRRAMGGNPCLEQTLESYEMCCLVETFPHRHESLDDFRRTLKYAFLYAKTVTLGRTQWPETNRVMLRNRRIGCSVSGVAQFAEARGLEELRRWLECGYDTIQEYDRQYSDWLAIPRSIKTTTVKPSGTVSLLAGATPGMHYPEARHYIRRVRLSRHSDLLAPLREAGYPVEPAAEAPDETAVVEIPVDVGAGVRTAREVSMWEQLSLAAFLQRHWSDNQVSCTVTFDPASEGHQIEHALNHFQYHLKGVSFLPRAEAGAYQQMPYEAITADEYARRAAALRPLDLSASPGEEAQPTKFCDGDACGLEGAGPALPRDVGEDARK